MKPLLTWGAVGILTGVLFLSCQKKEVDMETQSITDHILCEQEFMKIPTIVASRIGVVTDLNHQSTGTCPIDSIIIEGDTAGFSSGNIPIDTAGWSSGGLDTTGWSSGNIDTTGLDSLIDVRVSLLLEWGNVGCIDQSDNRLRKGRILTEVSGPPDQVGTKIVVMPENYTVDGITYNCSIVITKIAADEVKIEVNNGKCTDGSWTILWNSVRNIKWLEGANDNDETNDVLSVTGSSNGVNREGRKFTVLITKPLIKDAKCKWIQQGAIELTPDGFKTRTIDFGEGSCDNKCTFTVNGNVFNLDMP